MSRFLCGLFFSLLAGLSHAEQFKNINAALSLDSDGRMTQLEFKEPVADGLQSALRARIKRWQFSPVLVNGQPRAATVNLFINLAFNDLDDKMQVRIDSAGTSLRALKVAAPSYPRKELRAGVSGMVVLRLVVGEDGRVVQSSVIRATNERFSRAAQKTLKRFQFEPLLVDGAPARGEIYLPVRFTAGSKVPPPMPKLSELIGLEIDAVAGAMVAEQGGRLLSTEISGAL